jgi:hypothetical protein
MNETTRQITLRKLADLAVHPKVALTPELNEEASEWAAILGMTEERGEILTPLFITPDDEVLDGRHRLKAARACKLKTVPCLVIEDEDDQARIILDSICARRHYTKSARAYLALPLIEEAVADSARRSLNNLKVGTKSPKPNSVGFREKNGSEELAVKLGINPEYLRLARNTAEAFKHADAFLDKWLLAHPTEAKRWEKHETEGMSFNVWRAARLSDMGENANDPSAWELIPENLRERFEHELFNEDMGLGAINKAVRATLETKGKPRADLDVNNPVLHRTLMTKVNSFSDTMWKHWSTIPATGRVEVIGRLAERVKTWPEDVRRALAANLKEGGTGK